MNDHGVEVELVPIGLGKPDKGPGEDQAELRTFLGKRNVVRLGAPRWADYLTELQALQVTVPREVAQRVQEGYGFQRVRPTITLLPDRDCVFVAAELSVELYATSASGQPVGRPIAYDVQPVEVVEELPYRARSGTNVEVSGEAGAAFGKLLAKLTAENSLERNGVRVIQRLYGYGVNFSEVGWRMQAHRGSPARRRHPRPGVRGTGSTRGDPHGKVLHRRRRCRPHQRRPVAHRQLQPAPARTCA